MSECIKQTARQQLIAGLRAVADFYQQQPTAYYDGLPITLNMYICGTDAQQVLDHTSSLFSTCTLANDSKNITVSHKFNEQVTLSFFAARAGLRHGQD